jgi:hypothetical protein
VEDRQLASLQTSVGLGWFLQQQRRSRKTFQIAPQLLSQPTVTGGDSVGEEATVSDESSFSSRSVVEFEYQWQANEVDIPAATLRTLPLVVGLVGQSVRCIVTARNRFGSTQAASLSIVVTL